MRSRAAASQLSGLGFREVYSMEGGIKAWHGVVAEGVPAAGMPYFSPATGPLELIALAWLLEEGSRKFYQEMAPALSDEEAGQLFSQLIAAEEQHKNSLVKLYRNFSGKDPDTAFPGSVLPATPEEEIMEGGTRVAEAVQWAEGRPVRDVLDLSISLEANSYDLYIRMGRTVNDEQAKKVFMVLSQEEKMHLERLVEAFERRI